MAPDLVRRTRELLPEVKLVQVYGLSETGYLTGLQDHDHAEGRPDVLWPPAPGIELQIGGPSRRRMSGRSARGTAGPWAKCDARLLERPGRYGGCLPERLSSVPETSAIATPTGTFTSWTG